MHKYIFLDYHYDEFYLIILQYSSKQAELAYEKLIELRGGQSAARL